MPVRASQLVDVAQLAESTAFDSVWANDHIAVPAVIDTPYPFASGSTGARPLEVTPYADPLITLAFLAGVTQRVQLGTSVLVLPYRHPLAVAKAAATLDVLSGGRLILGVGPGWMREEFSALGVSFDGRMKQFDEQLEIMRLAWTKGTFAFDGAHYSFPTVTVEPRPSRPSGVPIWLGGHSPATLRRACRLGASLHWVAPSVDEVKERASRLAEIASREGTDTPPITIRASLKIAAEPAAAIGALKGPPSYLVELLAAYEDVGVTHFLVDNRKGGYEEMHGSLDHVLPVITEWLK